MATPAAPAAAPAAPAAAAANALARHPDGRAVDPVAFRAALLAEKRGQLDAKVAEDAELLALLNSDDTDALQAALVAAESYRQVGGYRLILNCDACTTLILKP